MANETWIKAIYCGEPGSLGFKTGEEYILLLSIFCNGSVKIHHYRGNSTPDHQDCPYGSLRAFLLNWTQIKYHI